jgi:hypothetical protein
MPYEHCVNPSLKRNENLHLTQMEGFISVFLYYIYIRIEQHESIDFSFISDT